MRLEVVEVVEGPRGARVAVMSTCLGDAMFPDAVRATVRLLRRLGCTVEVPEAQTCCGQPMVNTGYLDEPVPLVRNFVSAFEGYDHVVVPSGSCAGSVRHQHQLVAARSGDAALTDAVRHTSPRTLELSEFLVDVLGVVDVGASFPHRVTYHPTCHSLRVLRVRGHLRPEERRDLGGDGVGQGLARALDRRRGARRR